jgi:rare lipoprotein A
MKSLALSALIAVLATFECRAQAVGLASYYTYSSGLVGAHRTYPVGSHVRVTNLSNGRSTTVVIVGRGPFVPGRIIDLSTAAADELGFRQAGVAKVQIELVQQ